MWGKFEFVIIGVLTVILSGCASNVPLTSLPKLRGLDPETMDMSELEMAVRIPQALGIRPGTATLRLEMESPSVGKTLKRQMILAAPNPELTDYLKRQAGDDHRVLRFKMTEDQLAGANAFRQDMLNLGRASGDAKNNYSFSAFAGMCAKDPDATHGLSEAGMTFYIRTRSDKDFFKLFKERTMTFSRPDGEGYKLKACETTE